MLRELPLSWRRHLPPQCNPKLLWALHCLCWKMCHPGFVPAFPNPRVHVALAISSLLCHHTLTKIYVNTISINTPPRSCVCVCGGVFMDIVCGGFAGPRHYTERSWRESAWHGLETWKQRGCSKYLAWLRTAVEYMGELTTYPRSLILFIKKWSLKELLLALILGLHP